MRNTFISTQWLAKNFNKPELVLLDTSMNKVVGQEPVLYDSPIYIPNSRKLDLESSFCDRESNNVHAFPPEEVFMAEIRLLGITSSSTVILYDNQGVYSAPRAWWIFQSMGFENVFVLNGGLPKWLSEGRPTVTEFGAQHPVSPNRAFIGAFNPECVCDKDYVLSAIDRDSIAIIDARSKERFLGFATEPRKGLRSGHIPNSRNLPFNSVLNHGCFKDISDLENIFKQLSCNESDKLVFTCGSGITACIILMAACIAGYENLSLYDGSWSEWGADRSLPIQTASTAMKLDS
ncbi:MAG: sulfurtransferase [Spirochaetota bacterium]